MESEDENIVVLIGKKKDSEMRRTLDETQSSEDESKESSGEESAQNC